jgi:GT2 family glycosyltransferase
MATGGSEQRGSIDADSSVAVVIPNWNTLDVLQGCIESVRAQDMPVAELLVVDNGSVDGSLAFLREERIPHVAYDANVGFAGAVNLGVAHTAAPFVCILNADTLIEPDALRLLTAALSAKPMLGGVQPLILQLEDDGPGDPTDPRARVYSAGQRLTRDGRGREEGMKETRDAVSIQTGEIFGVCGAACLLRRELFGRLGGYDERYFAFYEDVDLNIRARIAGWQFELAPDAVVWHIGNVAWKTGFRRPDAENARLVARNRLATQLKFMSFWSIPLIAAAELIALFQGIRHRRFRATALGKLQGLYRAPGFLAERRRLRAIGDLRAPRAWLGR